MDLIKIVFIGAIICPVIATAAAAVLVFIAMRRNSRNEQRNAQQLQDMEQANAKALDNLERVNAELVDNLERVVDRQDLLLNRFRNAKSVTR